MIIDIKVVPGGCHDKIFGVKFETVKLIGGSWFFAAMSGLDDFKVALYVCPNHADDGIYSDHGYLETSEIPLGPP